MNTWRELITVEMEERGEAWGDVVGVACSEGELDRQFDSGYGGSEGAPFTLWTMDRVYFPAVYDGLEWVASVPRNPCDEEMEHVGCQ